MLRAGFSPGQTGLTHPFRNTSALYYTGWVFNSSRATERLSNTFGVGWSMDARIPRVSLCSTLGCGIFRLRRF